MIYCFLQHCLILTYGHLYDQWTHSQRDEYFFSYGEAAEKNDVTIKNYQ